MERLNINTILPEECLHRIFTFLRPSHLKRAVEVCTILVNDPFYFVFRFANSGGWWERHLGFGAGPS